MPVSFRQRAAEHFHLSCREVAATGASKMTTAAFLGSTPKQARMEAACLVESCGLEVAVGHQKASWEGLFRSQNQVIDHCGVETDDNVQGDSFVY
mmetsp:Transcript_24526/g.50277  ORF Transcript_24526/g.50277 Transcript_24526/m.50277 type:complete len:95 (-) Transcript_24526:106-390(-)